MKQTQTHIQTQLKKRNRQDPRRSTQVIQFTHNEMNNYSRNDDTLSSFQSSLNFFRKLEEKNKNEKGTSFKQKKFNTTKIINDTKIIIKNDSLSYGYVSNDNYCGIMSFKRSNHTVIESIKNFKMIMKRYLGPFNQVYKFNEENIYCNFQQKNTTIAINKTQEAFKDENNQFIRERLFDFEKIKSIFK